MAWVHHSRTVPTQRKARNDAATVRLEPIPQLEWSLATEADAPITEARCPAEMRQGWVHQAPIEQVLNLYRRLTGRAAERTNAEMSTGSSRRQSSPRRTLAPALTASLTTRRLPAPWWLVALDRAELDSRGTAFALEDDVHALLSARPGWVFVPWALEGESGFWEYAPSDHEPITVPTSVGLSAEHSGWIHVTRAYAENPASPLRLTSVKELTRHLPDLETGREPTWGFPAMPL